MPEFLLLHEMLPPLSVTNSHLCFVCMFYIRSSLYNHEVAICKGKWIPARARGQADQQVHWGSGWCGYDHCPWSSAVPAKDPFQRERPLGIGLRSSFRRVKHPLPFAPSHTPQPGMWKAAGPEPPAPYLAGLYIWLTQPVVLFVWVS